MANPVFETFLGGGIMVVGLTAMGLLSKGVRHLFLSKEYIEVENKRAERRDDLLIGSSATCLPANDPLEHEYRMANVPRWVVAKYGYTFMLDTETNAGSQRVLQRQTKRPPFKLPEGVPAQLPKAGTAWWAKDDSETTE